MPIYHINCFLDGKSKPTYWFRKTEYILKLNAAFIFHKKKVNTKVQKVVENYKLHFLTQNFFFLSFNNMFKGSS